jgi:hypothetical protein
LRFFVLTEVAFRPTGGILVADDLSPAASGISTISPLIASPHALTAFALRALPLRLQALDDLFLFGPQSLDAFWPSHHLHVSLS